VFDVGAELSGWFVWCGESEVLCEKQILGYPPQRRRPVRRDPMREGCRLLTKSVCGLKEGPGAKALLKTLALFVRLKPHAPSGKALKLPHFLQKSKDRVFHQSGCSAARRMTSKKQTRVLRLRCASFRMTALFLGWKSTNLWSVYSFLVERLIAFRVTGSA
jgi:hypothetical protein